MSDDLDMQGRIELEFIQKGLNDLLTGLGKLNEAEGHTNKQTVDLEKGLAKLVGTTERQGAAAAGSAKDTKKYADGFGDLVKELNKFVAAHKEATQLGVVGGSLDGRGKSDLEALSTSELREYIAIDDARSVNAVAVARTIVSERDREAKAAEMAAQRSIAAIQQEHQARVAAYSAEVAMARNAEAQQAAARGMSGNWANIGQGTANGRNTAAMNSGSVFAKQAAQEEYAAQATREYSAEIGRKADAHNRAFEAAHAEALAMNALTGATKQGTESIITQRYALYDVATTYGVISAALLATAGGALKVGADFESAFTSVERTTDGTAAQVKELRALLVDMSTEMPLAFEDLAQIASLGNQLGIEADHIDDFTGTVARFAAVSGLSVDSVAESFGKISNLTGLAVSDYEKFGSAVALVARTSASTEKNIISTAKEIAATGAQAGFTAPAVVGLAGALASLAIAPERARGSLDTYFGTLERAVAGGGEDLENFSIVTGIAADELDRMVRNGEGQQVFMAFLEGLGQLDNVAKTTALDELGLKQLRVSNSFKRLSGDLGTVRQAFDNANQGFGEGTELASQYAKVVDDLSSQWMMFVNSINALIDTVTGGAVPGVAALLGVLTNAVNAIRDFMSNEDAQRVANFVLVLTAVVGGMTLFTATSALATASTYALMTAQSALAGAGGMRGIVGLLGVLIPGLATYSTTAAGATTMTYSLAGAMRAFMRATIVLALVGLLVEVMFNFRDSMLAATGAIHGISMAANGAVVQLGNLLTQLGRGLGFLGQGIAAVGTELQKLGSFGMKGTGALQKWAKALPKGATNDFSGATKSATDMLAGLTDGAGLGGGALDKLGKGAGGAAKKVRTLVDYGNDLSQVWSRAFEIRFSGEQGFDTITSGWLSIADGIAKTNEEIADYQAKMMSLTADRAVKEYWLSVAENYGDVLRAGELRAELAEIDDDLRKESGKLTKAQDKNSKSLTGNTEGAIENRKEILGLVTNYQSYIAALASSGMSQADLQAKAAQLKQEFIAQATQLGYSRAEIEKYALSFDDVALAIARVPRDITVTANTNPALQALNEFEARMRSMGGNSYSGGSVSVDTSGAEDDLAKAARGAKILALYNKALKSGADNVAIRYLNQLNSGNYWTGGFVGEGYTGSGGKYEPKGVVHGGEFVFSKQATSNIGVDNLAFLHNMGKQGKPVSAGSGGGAGGGTQVVELSAFDRQLLAEVGNLQVVIPGVAIAKATSMNNVNASNRGSA